MKQRDSTARVSNHLLIHSEIRLPSPDNALACDKIIASLLPASIRRDFRISRLAEETSRLVPQSSSTSCHHYSLFYASDIVLVRAMSRYSPINIRRARGPLALTKLRSLLRAKLFSRLCVFVSSIRILLLELNKSL